MKEEAAVQNQSEQKPGP